MMKNILILGVGNILMGDEGIGIHSIKELEKNSFPENVTLLDGGTGGFHLLNYLQEYKIIIMIDASMDNKPEGTVSVIEPKFASDFPKSLSAHDIGLRDLIESVSLLGELPKIFLITISINHIQNMSMELSQKIKASLSEIAQKVESILHSLNQ
ncbi:MAG: hydrogenase maturation protease [Ignavibacteria bacterium]|nr:hydrogenase maturation protease [Ignavibacteria bacterium]